MSQTLSEKILAQASGQRKVKAGNFIKARVDVAMMPDVTAVLAFEAMRAAGSEKVWDPEKVVLILDHVAPPSSVNSARVHNVIREFVKKPGMVVIGADSHTCTHGAFGAFATGVGSTDMGAILARGKTWLKVPETIKVEINGKLPQHVYAKDVILKTVGLIGVSGATYMALEFKGSTVESLSVSGRMTLCNMAIEMGSKTGICEPDNKTFEWLKRRTDGDFIPLYADLDASYIHSVEFDVKGLEPQIACPHNVDNVKPVSEVCDVKINQAFIGSCTNGRLEDLQQAQKILKGRQIDPDVRLLVVPASREVFRAALEEGIIIDLINAGATVSNPSCAACFGGHIGILGPGENGITTSNRNFRGRQGSPQAGVYLSNAAVAAASALTGYVTNPHEVI
jgi:3-isopropylmalate/(R)-2-methylmalate dehydratase large subunit